jgi:hypothetical protein
MVLVIGRADNAPAEGQRTLAVTPDLVVCVFMLAHDNFSFYRLGGYWPTLSRYRRSDTAQRIGQARIEQALNRFFAPISRWLIEIPLNACRFEPLTDIEREGVSPPILVTSVTSAILAEVITALARTHTPRHPASVHTEVLYFILIVFIGLGLEF